MNDTDEMSSLHSGLLNQFSNPHKFALDQRVKEIAEQKQVKVFTRKLKCFSYFFLFLALYILLNACIGFSSAPFYLPDINCNRIEPNEKCKALAEYTSVLYSVEIIGSFLLFIQALLAIAILDHMKSLALLRLFLKFTKLSLLVYFVLVVTRIGLYLTIHFEVLDLDYHNKD